MRICERLRARGREVQLQVFADVDAVRRWAAIGGSGCGLLVCIGGDGTLDTAAFAAVRRRVPFLAVPCGFANPLGRALALPRRVDHVVDLVEHGKLVDVDVGLRDGQPFLCNETFGLLSEIQQHVETVGSGRRSRGLRSLAYYCSALRHCREAALPSMRVVVDGRVVATNAAIVVVANMEAYGVWLPLTRGASPTDGLLDVFTIERTTKARMLARVLSWQLRLSRPEPGVHAWRGRRVLVAAPRHATHHMGLMSRRLSVLVSRDTADVLHRSAAPAQSCAPVVPSAMRV